MIKCEKVNQLSQKIILIEKNKAVNPDNSHNSK